MKNFEKSGRTLKGYDYVGYDDFNYSSEKGLYVWLKFNNEKYEVNCYVLDDYTLHTIFLIDEVAQEEGNSFGKILYYNGEINDGDYFELVIKTIDVLKKEEYIN